jgi:hypothetical protein
VARGLHRTSRRYHAEARATLRHLDLASYYRGLLSAYPDPATRPPAIPWELLAACPGVTHWTLHQEQLACFTAGTAEQLAAAASKLKRLKVTEARLLGAYPAPDSEQEGLGRLLWACRRLEEVDISLQELRRVGKPWLLIDPASTSFDTAVAPPLALRSWESTCIPYECLTTWLDQQQQLGGTLQHVVMRDAGLELDLDGFAALPRLRHLGMPRSLLERPCSVHMSSPTVLSSITALHMFGGMEAAELACQLNGLQDLRLNGRVLPRLPSGIAALKQLSALDISFTSIRELPADLGVWLPRLERLVGKDTPLATVPATLTRLTHLDLRGITYATGQLALPTSLGRLQELVVPGRQLTAMVVLGQLTALQLLRLSVGAEDNLASLRPLTRLRHLDPDGWEWHPAAYGVLAGLQQLTFLSMGIRYGGPELEWLLPPQLPALRALHIFCEGQPHPLGDMAALGPWLVQLTALEQLVCSCSSMAAGDAPLHLPPQLQELEWAPAKAHPDELCELPRGLTQLSALRALRVTWQHMCVLPPWLSELRCLEELWYAHKGEATEQEVLAHMPALRRVGISTWRSADFGEKAIILGRAPHLHFKHGG